MVFKVLNTGLIRPGEQWETLDNLLHKVVITYKVDDRLTWILKSFDCVDNDDAYSKPKP